MMYIHIEFGYRMYIESLAHTHTHEPYNSYNQPCMFSKDLVVNFQGFDIRTTQIGYFTPKLRQWPCGASDKAGEKIGVFFWGDVNARQTALESL